LACCPPPLLLPLPPGLVSTSLLSCFRVWVRFFEASARARVSSRGFLAAGSPLLLVEVAVADAGSSDAAAAAAVAPLLLAAAEGAAGL